MSITFFSQGGAEEVTGSKHFISTGKATVMLDCGAFQGKRAEADKKNREWAFNAADLDGIILSHAHYDHSGLLPLLKRKGYSGNIYSTPASRDLANLILMDSASIQSRDAEYLRKQAAKRGETFNWQPLYSDGDVVDTLNQFITVSYERPFLVADGIKASFYDAGHILGSSQVHMEVKTQRKTLNIAYSGDLGRKNKPILRDPVPIPDADYLIMESTYGDRKHEKPEDILISLERIINRAVHRGGKILIPAFAVERTQDMVFYLHLLLDDKRIPEIPVFVDSPMATNATAIFRIHPECYDEETKQAFTEHNKNPFGFNSLRYIESVSQSKELNDLKGPAIIISSSGMCEAGRIQHHLLHNLPDPKTTVLIVGFMAKETLGRKIQERRREVRIFGNLVPVRAEVEEIKALSAHADYLEIGEHISHLNLDRLKKVFLVHGEPPAARHLKKHLLSLGVKAVDIVKPGRRYRLQ